MLAVSIIIVNWNTLDLLRNCLQSLYQSTRRVRLQVIVVDNASDDGSSEMVLREFPQVILIQNESNLGFAKANNIGLQHCSEDFVLLLNSDTLINDGAIDSCVEFMAMQPKIGVLGCKVVYPNGAFQSSYFKFERLRDVILTECLPPSVVIGAGKLLGHNLEYPSRYWGTEFSHSVEVDVVAGCFFLVRKEVVAQVGHLDEEFFFYGEEAEWCFRIKCHGWKIIYFPLTTIIHIHGASSRRALFSANLASRRARLLVLEKTQGTTVAWTANLIMLCGNFVRLPVWLSIVLLQRIGFYKSISSIQFVERIKLHLTGLWEPVWRPSRSQSTLGAAR